MLVTLTAMLVSLTSLAYPNTDIKVVIEEPVAGGSYSGISNLRGYVVSPNGTGWYNHNVYIDGEFAFHITSFGERTDVRNAYPDYPDSGTGGFSMALNYKDLSPGEHEITIRGYDDAGSYNEASVTFIAERFNSTFIAENSEVNLSTTDDIYLYDDQTYLIRGASVEGERWDFLLTWDRASQSFKTEGIVPFDSELSYVRPDYYSEASDASSDSFGGYTDDSSMATLMAAPIRMTPPTTVQDLAMTVITPEAARIRALATRLTALAANHPIRMAALQPTLAEALPTAHLVTATRQGAVPPPALLGMAHHLAAIVATNQQRPSDFLTASIGAISTTRQLSI